MGLKKLVEQEVRKGSSSMDESCGGARERCGARKKRSILDSVRFVLGICLIIVGVGLVFAPNISTAISQKGVNERVVQIQESLSAAPDSSEGVGNPSTVVDEIEPLKAYNAEVREGVRTVNDPFGFADVPFDAFAQYGLSDGIIGTVDIPAMDTKLPLYLGASDANLAKGAAVVSGTSMPLGEESSNCVIAAHRVPQFRSIETLAVGDGVEVTTPWQVMRYRVAEVQIITPNDTEALAVRPGQDLVTLLTCHPYDGNYQRYLVICERDDQVQVAQKGVVEHVADFAENVAHGTVPTTQLEDALKVALAVFLALFLVVECVAVIIRRRRRNRHPQK